jgi:hypothetical protein
VAGRDDGERRRALEKAGAAATHVASGSVLRFTLLARWFLGGPFQWLRQSPRAAAVLLVGFAILRIRRSASL